MIPASSIATIPTPPRVVLIRVATHDSRGDRHYTPLWHIVGELRDYEWNQRWLHFETEVTLGLQKDGSFLLDVTDLGLDPETCLTYHDAEERREQLDAEEERYNLHDDDGPCLCGQIAVQMNILRDLKPAIEEAVFERFDAWTRRRHLVALGVALGFQDFDRPAWLERLGLLVAAEPEAEPVASASAATMAPSPVAADWTL